MADSDPSVTTAPVIVDSPVPSSDVSLADLPSSSATPPPAADPTPSKIDPAYQELNQHFGIDSSTLADDAAAVAALRPVIGMLAQSGVPQNAPVQPQGVDPGTVPVTPGQPLPPDTTTVPEFSFDDVDFGDAGPEVEKAFKKLGAQNQKALQQVMGEAQAAKKSADEAKQIFVNSNAQSVQAQEQQVLSRANSYLDTLASAKYGVGQQRTMIQQMASQQVMQIAGNIIRGTQNHGQTPPSIEAVMKSAIVYIEGKLPVPAPPAIPPVPGLAHQTATGAAPAPVQGSGSAGSGGELMNDPKFMDGARAIMSR